MNRPRHSTISMDPPLTRFEILAAMLEAGTGPDGVISDECCAAVGQFWRATSAPIEGERR